MIMSTFSDLYTRGRASFVEFINALAARLGLNPLEFKRFVKFAFVGAIGALVDFSTYNILLGPLGRLFSTETWGGAWLATRGLDNEQLLTLSTVAAGTISFILAILSNFVWNRYWTYPDSRSKALRRQFLQFFVVNVSGILIRIPVIAFTHRLFTNLLTQFHLATTQAERLGSNLALALAVGIVMFWNFFANRYWTYNDVSQ